MADDTPSVRLLLLRQAEAGWTGIVRPWLAEAEARLERSFVVVPTRGQAQALDSPEGPAEKYRLQRMGLFAIFPILSQRYLNEESLAREAAGITGELPPDALLLSLLNQGGTKLDPFGRAKVRRVERRLERGRVERLDPDHADPRLQRLHGRCTGWRFDLPEHRRAPDTPPPPGVGEAGIRGGGARIQSYRLLKVADGSRQVGQLMKLDPRRRRPLDRFTKPS